jgi:AcrR family transcriptional regulator
VVQVVEEEVLQLGRLVAFVALAATYVPARRALKMIRWQACIVTGASQSRMCAPRGRPAALAAGRGITDSSGRLRQLARLTQILSGINIPASMSGRRLNREQKKTHTRGRLLKAAERVFARRGYVGASLDDVAEEAGFSKGAIYSNFKNKEDLFLALVDQHIEERVHDIQRTLATDRQPNERAREAARHYIEHLNESADWNKVVFDGWVRSMRDRTFGAKFTARFEVCRRALTQAISARFAELRVPLPFPAERLAIAIDALALGIFVEKLARPNAVPDDLLGDVVSLLLRDAVPSTSKPLSMRASRDRASRRRGRDGPAHDASLRPRTLEPTEEE